MVQYGAAEVVRAIRMFGWDAVFFDVAPYGMIHYGVNNTNQPNPGLYTWDGRPWHRGADPDAASAKIARRTRELIRKHCPHVVLWYNGADPRRAARRPAKPGRLRRSELRIAARTARQATDQPEGPVALLARAVRELRRLPQRLCV